MRTKTAAVAIALALLTVLAPPRQARAEAAELRVAEQFGIAYLPFLVMRQEQLIEKHAPRQGLPGVKVNWVKFGGGASMNEALISGSLDFAAAGIPVFLALWNKTKGGNDVKVAAGLNNIPVFLNTTNPKVRSIRDFGDGDKIALPAVKVSLQAMILQMAAAREWGPANATRLDHLTVSMKHPDAMVALLSGKSEINSHFTGPPFMFQELAHPGVHTVLNSADLLGAHNFNVVYTSERFRGANPKLYQAYVDALDEAMRVINADKAAATRLYMKLVPSGNDSFDDMYEIVSHPAVEFTTVPRGLKKFADFMAGTGALQRKAESWRDYCFPEAAGKAGS